MEKIPSEERIKWMVENVPDDEKNAMIKDLLTAAKNACETSNLESLAETMVDWEATIETHLMIEGYQEMAEEHLAFARLVFPLAKEVLPPFNLDKKCGRSV